MIVKSPSGEILGIFAGKVLELGEGDSRLTIAGIDFSVALTTKSKKERVYISVKDGKIEVETLENSTPEENTEENEKNNDKNDTAEGDDKQTEGDDSKGGDEGGDSGSKGGTDNGDEGGDKGENSGGDESEGTGEKGSRRYTRIEG